MTRLLWDRDELVEFLQADDPEVRYWAIDRLVRHFPDECADEISEFLLDDHEATPAVVARHLGEHGHAGHHAMLTRGFRLLRGMTPAFCLQALVRLGAPGAVELASDALKRGDLDEPARAVIVEALAQLGTSAAAEVVREDVARHPELLVEPAALRGVLKLVKAEEIPELLENYLKAIRWRGLHRAGEALRTLMDSLGIDDAGWCLRTGPSGHIEFRKTVKAVESGYDCDISATLGETTVKQIAQRFRAGNVGEIVKTIAEWTCGAAEAIPRDEQHDQPLRMAAAVGALSSPATLDEAAALGGQFEQWLLGFHLSAAFAAARGVNADLSLANARGDLDRLLGLAEIETAHQLGALSSAISVVCREDERAARKAQDWCLRMLEAQGPFFPKVVALETLGELQAVHFIPEMIDYLADENSYVYSAAERALARMGEAIVTPAESRIIADDLDPDAAHSILLLLCDIGSPAAFDAVSRHFDWFMDAVGPGTTAEWVSLLGMGELIEPMRDWLDEDPALVGQALLLLGAIHGVEIPEEDEILQAIEDERMRQAGEQPPVDPALDDESPDGDDYVM